MANKLVRLAESSLERTARILSSNYGIQVVFHPDKCETNGKTIYLPTLPDDAPEELLGAMQGYLDHETGHVLFTDFSAPGDLANQKHGRAILACANVIEDIRIEERMGVMFPGSRYNLRNAHAYVYKKIRAQWNGISAFDKVLAGVFIEIKYPGSDLVENFVEPEIRERIKQAVAVVKDPTTTLLNTREAIEEGHKLFESIEDLEKEEEAPRPSQVPEGLTNGNEPLKAAPMDSLGEQLMGNVKVVRSTYVHGLENDRSYMIYSTQYDSYGRISDGTRDREGTRLLALREESRNLVNTIRQRLVNSLRAIQQRRWQGSRKEGKLDTRALYRAFSGGSNVHKQRTDRLAIDTAVAMMIDHSGSMHGRQLELAGEAAIVLGDVFNLLKIPFMVYGYSTAHGHIPASNAYAQYARWNSLWIATYGDFQDPWESTALRLTKARDYGKHNTLDGEALKYGVQRLLARPEKRRIMIVFNDGEPYPGAGHIGRCQQYLKDVVASSSKKGVEIIAFGVMTDNVKYYYPDYVVINDLLDMIKQPLAKMDEKLRKNMISRRV